MNETYLVAAYSLLTALATGLGALPFFFLRSISKRQVALFSALAAGLMLGASADLLHEGSPHGASMTLLGATIGGIFIALIRFCISRFKRFEPEDFLTVRFQSILMIMVVMTAHSFAEGISIGFGFGSTHAFGILIAVAIGLQNIPEGLAISATLVPRGVSPLRAAWWSIFSSLPQLIMAVHSFLFITFFKPLLPVGLGFAAGAMLWMIAYELVPEARKNLSWPIIMLILAFSTVLMIWLSLFTA